MNQVTNKLFYGKYPYKVRCKIRGVRVIKTCGFNSNGITWKDTNKFSTVNYDKKSITEFFNSSEEFLSNTNILKRYEFHCVDFYVQDKNLFSLLISKLSKYVTGIWEPSNDLELSTLIDNNKLILCNKLPYNTYKYKIYFKDMPANIRLNLISWAEKYNEQNILVKKSTKIHFKLLKYKYGPHYFYVKEEKMLTMIKLAASGFVRKVEEFAIRSDINTKLNQELECQL